MESFRKSEELIMCPFNHAHHIRRSRFNAHLVKCEKNHRDNDMAICDFNTTHRVPKTEIQHHMEVCPDRKKIEIKVAIEEDEDEDEYPIPKLNIEPEENWDDDNAAATYDPEVYCKGKAVVRNLILEPRSKKKMFRQQERERLSQLEGVNKNPPLPPTDVLDKLSVEEQHVKLPQNVIDLKRRVEERRKKFSVQQRLLKGDDDE